MKKLFTLLLAGLMLLSVAGCGAEQKPDATEPMNTTESVTESTTESTTDSTTDSATSTTTESDTTKKPTKPSVTKPTESHSPLTLTIEKYQGKGHLYKDKSVAEVNYTLKLTANTDLKALRLLDINPDTSMPEAALYTLTALKKGESQYILTYINDAAPNRGVLCTDAQGHTHYYVFVFSGQSGSIHLREIKPNV